MQEIVFSNFCKFYYILEVKSYTKIGYYLFIFHCF